MAETSSGASLAHVVQGAFWVAFSRAVARTIHEFIAIVGTLHLEAGRFLGLRAETVPPLHDPMPLCILASTMGCWHQAKQLTNVVQPRYGGAALKLKTLEPGDASLARPCLGQLARILFPRTAAVCFSSSRQFAKLLQLRVCLSYSQPVGVWIQRRLTRNLASVAVCRHKNWGLHSQSSEGLRDSASINQGQTGL